MTGEIHTAQFLLLYTVLVVGLLTTRRRHPQYIGMYKTWALTKKCTPTNQDFYAFNNVITALIYYLLKLMVFFGQHNRLTWDQSFIGRPICWTDESVSICIFVSKTY